MPYRSEVTFYAAAHLRQACRWEVHRHAKRERGCPEFFGNEGRPLIGDERTDAAKLIPRALTICRLCIWRFEVVRQIWTAC